MDIKQKERLERYLKNADRFLWGLAPGNQIVNYKWLYSHGFNNNGDRFKGGYIDTTEKLIKNYGIEKILKDLIKERVNRLYPSGFIDLLRKCWRAGVRPSVEMLKANGFEHTLENKELYILLSYNKQFKYIEGWGQFAGLWFEEIEDLIKNS